MNLIANLGRQQALLPTKLYTKILGWMPFVRLSALIAVAIGGASSGGVPDPKRVEFKAAGKLHIELRAERKENRILGENC